MRREAMFRAQGVEREIQKFNAFRLTAATKADVTALYPQGFQGPEFGATDFADAFEFVEAVCEMKGLWFSLKTPFMDGEPYWAGFTPKGTSGWNGRHDYRASGDSAPNAMAAACFRALGLEENGSDATNLQRDRT